MIRSGRRHRGGRDVVVTGMKRHSHVEGKLRWEVPLRRECEVRTRFAEEAVLHRGEPYVWIGFGFENDREEERQISIALFLHSRRARSYAMRLLKQMGVRSAPEHRRPRRGRGAARAGDRGDPAPGRPRHEAEHGAGWQVAGRPDPHARTWGRVNGLGGSDYQVIILKPIPFVSIYLRYHFRLFTRFPRGNGWSNPPPDLRRTAARSVGPCLDRSGAIVCYRTNSSIRS